MTTEIIAKNSLSRDLQARLKDQGKKLTDAHIVRMYQATEGARVSYQSKSILSGIAFLAKKTQMPHGKFKEWFDATFVGDQNGSARPFSKPDTYRTARTNMSLAKRFLGGLESGALYAELAEKKLGELTAENAIAITGENEQSAARLLGQIETFVAGRSIRQMLADFLAASQDAAAEAREEEACSRTCWPEEPSGEATEANGNPPPAQFDFFDALERDVNPGLKAFRVLFSNPMWGREDVPAGEKLKACGAIRAQIKMLETILNDKEAALKKGAEE